MKWIGNVGQSPAVQYMDILVNQKFIPLENSKQIHK